MNPKISVIMPVYNGEKFLDKAIESILNQSYKDFEFIIVNDGSSDSSLNIIQKYKKQDDRIVAISRENKGLVYSLNEAIKLSKGKYIARMDADDISLQSRFEEQVKILDEKNNIDIVGCHYNIIDNNDNIKKVFTVPLDKDDIFFNLFYGTPFAHPSVMTRRDILSDNLYSDDKATNAVEDYELWTRIYNGDNFYNINKILFNYRIYGESFSDSKRMLMYHSNSKVGFRFYIKNKQKIDLQLNKKQNSIFFYKMLATLGITISQKIVLKYLFKNISQSRSIIFYSLRQYVRYLYFLYKDFIYVYKK